MLRAVRALLQRFSGDPLPSDGLHVGQNENEATEALEAGMIEELEHDERH